MSRIPNYWIVFQQWMNVSDERFTSYFKCYFLFGWLLQALWISPLIFHSSHFICNLALIIYIHRFILHCGAIIIVIIIKYVATSNGFLGNVDVGRTGILCSGVHSPNFLAGFVACKGAPRPTHPPTQHLLVNQMASYMPSSRFAGVFVQRWSRAHCLNVQAQLLSRHCIPKHRRPIIPACRMQ